MDYLRTEIQRKYINWINGYKHNSNPRSEKQKEENLEHVKMFVKKIC